MTTTVVSVIQATGASSGRAAGPVFRASEGELGAEQVTDWETAVEAVALRLTQLAGDTISSHKEGAAILEAQATMVRDPALADAVQNELASGKSLRESIRAAAERYARRLEALEDAYLRERAADVREVGRLLALEVTGKPASRLSGLSRASIIFAHELSPADTLGVSSSLLLGLVTEIGGLSSHAAIVARELGIPAVVGAVGAVEAAGHFPAAEIDGASGEVRLLANVQVHASNESQQAYDVSAAPVTIMANVGSSESALAAARRGAHGIGLFRTELMFMAEQGPMSEEDQFAVYRAACEAMAPHTVVVRTLDSGADKPLPYLPASAEPNPQLGKRGVRQWLAVPELWRPQMRALLRTAALCPNLRVMLPMVAARTEMVLARRRFATEARVLGTPLPPIGMMVEVPGVAVALEAFSGVADFISFGTNDLTQYTAAADRELPWGEELSEFSPGVLRLIATAVTTAHRLGIPAGVCGEMAGRPLGAIFLAGVGVDSLSMTMNAVPSVVAALGHAGIERCQRAAADALVVRRARRAVRVLGQALA